MYFFNYVYEKIKIGTCTYFITIFHVYCHNNNNWQRTVSNGYSNYVIKIIDKTKIFP